MTGTILTTDSTSYAVVQQPSRFWILAKALAYFILRPASRNLQHAKRVGPTVLIRFAPSVLLPVPSFTQNWS